MQSAVSERVPASVLPGEAVSTLVVMAPKEKLNQLGLNWEDFRLIEASLLEKQYLPSDHQAAERTWQAAPYRHRMHERAGVGYLHLLISPDVFEDDLGTRFQTSA